MFWNLKNPFSSVATSKLPVKFSERSTDTNPMPTPLSGFPFLTRRPVTVVPSVSWSWCVLVLSSLKNLRRANPRARCLSRSPSLCAQTNALQEKIVAPEFLGEHVIYAIFKEAPYFPLRKEGMVGDFLRRSFADISGSPPRLVGCIYNQLDRGGLKCSDGRDCGLDKRDNLLPITIGHTGVESERHPKMAGVLWQPDVSQFCRHPARWRRGGGSRESNFLF